LKVLFWFSFFKQPDGTFIINSKEPLDTGIYLLIFNPKKNYQEILITKNDQNIEISFDYNNIAETIQFQGGSNENRLFTDYVIFDVKKKNELKALSQGEVNSGHREKITSINNEISAYQNKIIKEHPRSFTAAIIKTFVPIKMAKFNGSKEEKNHQSFQFFKKHYFDNVNLADPRMLKTPFLIKKVEQYIDKLNIQRPDSISKAIDFVLKKMKPSKETYRTYVVHFLNKYAKSKILGMDAVYVHIIDNYYAKGKTPWIEDSQLKNLIERANTIKPTLIGKLAPNMTLEAKNGVKFDLHDVKSKYTVLFFWNENCDQCKKSVEKNLLEDYEKLKNLDVELLAICLGNSKEIQNGWDYANDTSIKDWFHVKLHSENDIVRKKYDLRSLPRFYILDSNKNIVSKQITAEQLIDILMNLNKK
jgi:thiol-disulfide isomerase/thioredoxin